MSEKKEPLHKKLGLSDKKCPKCGAHLTESGICLNACHLSDGARKRFNLTMSKSMRNTGHPMAVPIKPEAIASIIMSRAINTRLPIEEHFDTLNRLEVELRAAFKAVVEAAQHEFIEAAKHVDGYPDLLADAGKMHKATVEAITKLDIAREMGYKKR